MAYVELYGGHIGLQTAICAATTYQVLSCVRVVAFLSFANSIEKEYCFSTFSIKAKYLSRQNVATAAVSC